jgi:hypothetical protein
MKGVLSGLPTALMVCVLVAVNPATAQPAGEVDRFVHSSVSQSRLAAFALLLLLEPDDAEGPLLEALRRAGRLPRGAGGDAALERLLEETSLDYFIAHAGAIVEEDTENDIFGLMLRLQQLITREVREDRRVSRTRFYARMKRLTDGYEDHEVEAGRDLLREWLNILAKEISRLAAEQEKIYAESFISTDKVALRRLRDLSNALEWSAAQIVGDSSRKPFEPPPSVIDSDNDDTTESSGSGPGSGCSITSDSGCQP